MVKLLFVAAAISVVCRWAFGKWPWEFLAPGSARGQAAARARRVLGVDAGADRDEIIAAHRRLTAQVHPDRGGSDWLAARVNEAREVLLG